MLAGKLARLEHVLSRSLGIVIGLTVAPRLRSASIPSQTSSDLGVDIVEEELLVDTEDDVGTAGVQGPCCGWAVEPRTLGHGHRGR